MKKICILIISTSALIFAGYSQEIKTGETVIYNIKSCDPYKWNVMFDLQPGYLEIGPIASLGYEFNTEVRVRSIFTAYGSFRQPWFSKKSEHIKYIDGSYPWHKLAYTPNNAGELQTANILKPYYFFEVGGGIILSDKVNDVKTDVLLKEKKSSKITNWTSTGYTVEKTTERVTLPGVDSKERNIFQIRAGIWAMQSPIGLNKLNDAYEIENDVKIVRLIKNQNVPVSFNEINNVSKVNGQYVINFQKDKAYTMMYAKGVSAGISFIIVENLQITALGYGNKNANSNINFYLEGLYATSIKVDPLIVKRDDQIDVVYNDSHYDAIIQNIEGEYAIDNTKDINDPEKGGFSKKNIGFRAGIIGRVPGGAVKFEGGIRPGLDKMRWYVELSLGFDIPFTIKPFKPAEK